MTINFMDIKIDQIAGNIIVRPVKKSGRTNVYEFDYSVAKDLFLEPLFDEDVQLYKLVYVSTATIPFWGYIDKVDKIEKRHSVYAGYREFQSTLKVLRKDVNILPNKFTIDRDIWNLR